MREYDVLGRLVRYSGPCGVEKYAYLGAGWKRMSVTVTPSGSVESETPRFLYDSDNVLADIDGDSAIHTLYTTPFLDENVSLTRLSGPETGVYHYTPRRLRLCA